MKKKKRVNKIQPFDDPTMLRIGTINSDIYGSIEFKALGNLKNLKLHNFFIVGVN